MIIVFFFLDNCIPFPSDLAVEDEEDEDDEDEDEDDEDGVEVAPRDFELFMRVVVVV